MLQLRKVGMVVVGVLAFSAHLNAADEPSLPDYAQHIAPLFTKYCTGCHNAKDAEGKLVLEAFDGVLRGGEHGKIVVPGEPEKSRLIQVLEKKVEPFMPPEGENAPTAEEIALLKAWIKAGANGPAGDAIPMLVTPAIKPVGEVRQPIHAAAYSTDGKWLAVARHGRVEILGADDFQPAQVLEGHTGQVNDVGFSADGKLLFAAAGEPGLFGELTLWNTADWQRLHTIKGHRDSMYAAAISPDGTIVATGGYDYAIKLWDAGTGEEVQTLAGHNGAVFDLAFHPSGKILASASGDRTVKLWDVATGGRLDTLGQPEQDQYAVAFGPDGRHLAAGGMDKRIRVWRIRRLGREGTNPLLYARFAHEAAIVRLVFSPDGRLLISSGEDRAVKLWDARDFTQRQTLSDQPDWPSALAVAPGNQTLAVGRLDGTLSRVSLADVLGDETALAAPISEFSISTEQAATDSQPQEITEVEPNDAPDQATPLPVPGIAKATLLPAEGASEDVDLYRFEARQGEAWILETMAGRNKSPADTKIEVLHADGRPVLRALLRAVRESYITFRPIDSSQNQVRVKNWEEMDLNQYLYMSGEICKLFRMPQGPDSGFMFYIVGGKRRCYFDTTGTVHANEEPVYIVEPYPPGTELIDNGLPVFPLYYANDDDADRKLGSDSQLTFTAPADGTYLVRVTDVRGFGSRNHHYQLTLRPPQPDFNVSIGGKGAKVGRGSGQQLTATLDRKDNFHGEVRLDVTGVPDGFQVTTPIVVEAGHLEAHGVIHASPDVQAPPKEAWTQVKVTATATIGGREETKVVGNLGEIQLVDKPQIVPFLEEDLSPAEMLVRFEAMTAETTADDRPVAAPKPAPRPNKPIELVIAPGTTITALVRIERNGFDDELRFDVSNLPHGVIVDNIGLNGIMVRRGEYERQIFLTAADWVPETTRQIHAISQGAGNQASAPIVLHVRKAGELAQTD